MPIYESVQIRKPRSTEPGASIADINLASQGDIVATLDGNGLSFADDTLVSIDGGLVSNELTLRAELLAASVNNYLFLPKEGRWQVTDARSMIAVTGGASAAVMLRVCSSTQAPAAGTAQLTVALDLQETAPNQQVGVLIASPTVFAAGAALALDFSGTLTGLVGVLNVTVKRIA